MHWLQVAATLSVWAACQPAKLAQTDDEPAVLDGDGDGHAVGDDCDDEDPTVHPGAGETCNGRDDDCDGVVDEGVTWTFFVDADDDGWGEDGATAEGCETGNGLADVGRDCDDGDPTVHPDADEQCNGVDDDCNGLVDDEPDTVPAVYPDNDGDGFGATASPTVSCDPPTDHIEDGSDCDDTDPTIHPDASEVCDGVDNDCDGLADDRDPSVDTSTGQPSFYDADGDGYGVTGTGYWTCELPEGRAPVDTDCDDTDASVHPDQTETCNHVDDDCDGHVDWGLWVPDNFDTISEAIDQADDSDTVCVSSGSYEEDLDFSGKTIAVQGVDGSGSTTIVGTGGGPVVAFDSGETTMSVLAGFTITGGAANEGAGIHISNSSATLSDVIVTGNTCSVVDDDCTGVGLYCEDGSVDLDDVEVVDNSGNIAHPRLASDHIHGGGLWLSDCRGTFQDVDVRDNTASASGVGTTGASGVGVGLYSSEVVWSGGSVSGNATGSRIDGAFGAGIYLQGSLLDLSHVVVADNLGEARNVAGGGGAYIVSSTLTATNVVIAANAVGCTKSEGSSGGLHLERYGFASLENCDVVANTVDGLEGAIGGAVAFTDHTGLTFVNTNFVGNDAESGSALGATNSATDSWSTVEYCNFHGNGSDEFEGFTDPVGSDGNIAVDPEYVDTSSADPLEWDLTLDSSSDCIDAGSPALIDADGSTSDIGAYGGEGAAGW